MDSEKLINQYIEIVKSDEDLFYQDYLRTVDAVANSSAVYKGKPVPFLYQPMFFTKQDLDTFENIGKTLMSITNKIVDRYKESPEFRKKFGYSKLLEELILVDHGYEVNVPIGRFDIFYGGGDNFKFCEFNTDGSSAMNEDNTIGRILLETKAISRMKDSYEINYFELISKWVDESIKIFKEFNSSIEKPNVAIVDFHESGTPYEFKEFEKAYINKGYSAVIADPRELKYIDGVLYYNDMKIDLVYRRIVTRELIDRSEEIRDFINAYRDKAVCVIGPIKSQIMHNKIVFKILHDEDVQEMLTEEERDFIKKHIPQTKEFSGDRKIYDEVLNNKDNYIIKPLDLYASKGVYAGRDFTLDQWKERLDKSWNNDYICQEFCVPFTSDFVEFQGGKVKVSKFGNIVGLFMYNEKLAGMYTRIGKNSIISGLTDYYAVPNFLVE
ncbi:MAG: glutathionylspermidine synthase family protein [Tissierellales bacterium]